MAAKTKTRRPKKPAATKVAMQSVRDYRWCAARLKALADPDRLRIVNCLLRDAMHVSQIAVELGYGIVKASHHLGVLRRAEVVRTQKRGKFIIYSLHPDIAAAGVNAGGAKTLDLGCCRLDLLQSKTPH
jgi:DNA-binding transcriptional ArsR family regulator